jgi:Ca2+-binding RTX toxin-like protein
LTNFKAIDSLLGTAGSDTLIGSNRNSTWSITGTGSGIVGTVSFAAFENLEGGAANDSFKMLGGSVDSILGGVGIDTLTGESINNDWAITGPGAGSVNATLAFSELENLTGGTLDDVFSIAPSGSIPGTLSGGLGTNTLSYESWLTDVSINAVPGVASAVNLVAANFSILVGGAGNDTLTAFVRVPSVVIGNGGNDSLTGSTSGRDILFGGTGMDSLNGLGGDDILFGGQTSYDNSPSLLKDLHSEWKSTRTYQQRVDNLRGGPITGTPLNGDRLLANHPVDTLLDDGEVDTLIGGTGMDWFIKATDDILADLAIGEWVDSPTE